MPLGKIQLQIVTQLAALGAIDEARRAALAARPDDLTGEALEKLLQEEFKVASFALLAAKARALGLAPFNAARLRVSAQTFERIPSEFCRQHLVLPAGETGGSLLVVCANPFDANLAARIEEMAGRPVVRGDLRDGLLDAQAAQVRSTEAVGVFET